jgi:hypothetical protein
MKMEKYVCIVTNILVITIYYFIKNFFLFFYFYQKLYKHKIIKYFIILKMDMDTFILNDLNTYKNFENSYDESSENIIDVFVTSFEDKVLIDSATLNTIITLLEKIYANNLTLLFIMSCLGSLYVCSYNRRKKDYVIINNVEPKLLKGEIIEKV